MNSFGRRSLLSGFAGLPFASLPAWASAPMLGVSTSPFHRVKLGAFEVTTLLSGTAVRPDPQTIFGMNVSAEEFAAVSDAARLPIDQAQFVFTPTVVNTLRVTEL